MEAFTNNLNLIAALGTLSIGAVAVVALITHAFSRKEAHPLLDSVSKHLLWIGFSIALLGTLVSLLYSGVIGYAPCQLCWWQRIAIYPQVLLYAVALVTRDRGVFRYALALSIMGLVVALYHNYIDWGGSEFIVCDAAVSCTARYVYEFGFVTIPLMSLFGLLGLTATAWIGLERQGK
jgi:disulfide bond formation protein DsbB